MDLPVNQIICGDCLDVMKDWPDGCIDLILTDPPYGTTACKWDSIIPLEPMWEQLKRLIKPNGAIVMTASQPFTTTLIASNMKMFKYCWVWDKLRGAGFNYARFQPMRQHEDILVFYDKAPKYDSEGEPYDKPVEYKMAGTPSDSSHMTHSDKGRTSTATHRRKTSIIKMAKVNQNSVHPTQKPVALMEYLIKTYTNEGELVLDFTCGSGTTCVACLNTGRNYIGIEISEKYCEIARQRIEQNKGQMALFNGKK